VDIILDHDAQAVLGVPEEGVDEQHHRHGASGEDSQSRTIA
jgi:hypothetical protein